MVILGVIGGSGVYDITGLKVIKSHDLTTPFGKPSSFIIEATLNNKPIFFLARHGKGHRYNPSEVNYRANIFALKKLGVTNILSVSAVGIMKENIKPGDMIVPDQLFDRTKGLRQSTFFEGGIVGHVGFADPFCNEMRKSVYNAAKEKATTHNGGSLIVIEGPQFSTRCESNFYRSSLNPVAIGMTALPEAKLAREAEICYAILAMATDYDCWHEEEDDVTVEQVVKIVNKNAQIACDIISSLINNLQEKRSCLCSSAAKYAIMTSKDSITPSIKKNLSVLYGKYF